MQNENKNQTTEKILPNRFQYGEELLKIIRSNLTDEQLRERLNDYHDNDIALVLSELTAEERIHIYKILGADEVSNIFGYLEDPQTYVNELTNEHAADIIEKMDSDDAVDLLEELDDQKKDEIIELLDQEAVKDLNLINRYEDDEIGSELSTNYISINNMLTVKQAMNVLVEQASENDNISTIYVTTKDGKFYGAIDLRDLFIARSTTSLESIISTSYPYIYANEKIDNCLEQIKQYAEQSLPVLDNNNILIGVITLDAVIEAVDEQLGEDYAKLGGFANEEQLNQPILLSVVKRLPWLIILLVLSMGVSAVIGTFEQVIQALPFIIFFQSLILDMSGNVGTQSLSVTVRLLADNNKKDNKHYKFIFKELLVSITNGLILAVCAVVIIGLYMYIFKGQPFDSSFAISGCIAISLIVAMTVSGLCGTAIPLLLNKLKIDPAVASGPLITTINDLVSAVTYYGLAWLLLINL